ncbi:MAG: hypothetical protein IPH13_01385 [Planctomycetes bacterium]|nr:hypothetical protein [Planctomycetota bacterium]MCC7171477.1 hypothetical protein [Planctomycetota bacterium]
MRASALLLLVFGSGCAIWPTDREAWRVEVPTARTIAFSECGRFAMFQDAEGYVAAITRIETGETLRPCERSSPELTPWPRLQQVFGWTSIANAPTKLRADEQKHLDWVAAHFTEHDLTKRHTLASESTIEGLDREARRYARFQERVAELSYEDVPVVLELVVTLHEVTLGVRGADDQEPKVRWRAPIVEHDLRKPVSTPLPGTRSVITLEEGWVVQRE